MDEDGDDDDHIYIYTHKMAYYSAIERNEGMPWIANATWMGLEIIILSEVSQTEKDKYHMKNHLHVESPI